MIIMDKVVELVRGGSVVNGANPSSFFTYELENLLIFIVFLHVPTFAKRVVFKFEPCAPNFPLSSLWTTPFSLA